MHCCQFYLSGSLAFDPELLKTKSDRTYVKLVLLTRVAREGRAGEVVSDSQSLPVTCFGHAAERVKGLRQGDALVLGCRIEGSEFQPPDGPMRRSVRIIGEEVYLP